MKIFRRTKINQQEAMYHNLRRSQEKYALAIEEYDRIIKDGYDVGNAVSQLMWQNIQVCRETYVKLRNQYEMFYGNPNQFTKNMNEFYTWREENDISCIVLHPLELQNKTNIYLEEQKEPVLESIS